MSFFSNFNSEKCPCQITGNPLNGLVEKVCVEVNKVFDACIKQTQEEGLQLTLTNLTPTTPSYPLTFISAKSIGTTGTITNLQIDRLQDRPNFARVQATITIPVEVLFVDADNVEGKGTSTVTMQQDVIMFVPEPSIIPYTVNSVVSLVSSQGVYQQDNNFVISACVTLILKIVMTVDLLMPSYGYCNIPPCQDYSQEVCAGFFELPLFPNTNN